MENNDNKIPAQVPPGPSCTYDLLDDPSERSARYYIPEVGMLHIHYAGNYTQDKTDKKLDYVKFQPLAVLSFPLPYIELAFSGFEPVLLPNPDACLFGQYCGLPIEDFQGQLETMAKNLPVIRSVIERHFPKDAREENQAQKEG